MLRYGCVRVIVLTKFGIDHILELMIGIDHKNEYYLHLEQRDDDDT
jgi:hypothetical protein